MSNSDDDIVISFGPDGKYSLAIPIKDILALNKTGKSFIKAGLAMMLYAKDNKPDIEPPDELQKLFDWMTNSGEKAA